MKKYLILTIITAVIVIFAEDISYSPIKWDNNEYFTNQNIRQNKDTIIIFSECKWDTMFTVDLPDAFIEWSVSTRNETFNNIRAGKPPRLAGAHNGIVASYGLARGDSHFKINNAVKGMGFCPREEYIDEIIKILEQTKDSKDFELKLKTLETLYDNAKKYFSTNKLLSLELYSEPQFQTGTFINQFINPKVSIVFLDMPSYEVKAAAEMLHPKNPELTDYKRKIVHYSNLIHSYFHGDFDKVFIAVIYHTIEVFDNSPGKGGKGMRMMPLLP